MRKILMLCAAAMVIMSAGCGDDESENEKPRETISRSEEKGTVVGTADFSGETPQITISNIVSYVGEDIDYSSGVEVTNADKYEDFQMWVDASLVDIYEVGTYQATYRFVYDGETIEKSVIVSIVEKNGEPSGDTINHANNNGNSGNNADAGNNGNGGNNADAGNNGNGGNNADAGNNGNGGNNADAGNNGNGGNNADAGNNGNGGNNADAGNNGNGGNNADAGNNGNGGNTATQPPAPKPTSGKNEETTRRQIITSSNSEITNAYTLGYMNIELLSGKMVKIKCTSSKYIVSTRTDISTTTKNGINYKVYKLVITFNTGAEQVLEAYEEKQ